MTTHENFDRTHRSPRSESGFGIIVGTLLVAWALLASGREAPERVLAIAAGATFLIVSAAYPAILRPLDRAWRAIGSGLSRITTPIILGIFLYLVMTPIGLLVRSLGKNPLCLRFAPGEASYWIRRDTPIESPKSMRNQF
ncbi:MAG: SxtJ family membrane protein [Longimicrobiaceae bacterium]